MLVRIFRFGLLTPLVLATILGLVSACYAAGLRGGFLFDDFANLPSLGATGPISDLPSLARYLTSGNADPTGRPISVASFLLDAQNWPADPFPFKRTNLLLHLLNGALLFAVLLWLGRLNEWPRRKAAVAATIGALGWALNPFFVSTVLYVVQREAMWPATFILAGLLFSFVARSRILEGRPKAGYAWLLAGVGTCTLLAALSKANGILLPLLVMVVHACITGRDVPAERKVRRALHVTLGPIALGVVAWLAWKAISAVGDAAIPHRGWTISQRLLTEPTILADYLSRIFLLRPIDGSLLHDDYPVASSLFSPYYTGPFIALWGVVIASAWQFRRHTPALASAILFYIAAHIMESGPIGLELYFEHRNYVPAMLLFWPLGAALGNVRSRTVIATSTIALMTVLATLTHVQALVWGDPIRQAQAWANSHPDSARALSYVASTEANNGHRDAAIHRLTAGTAKFADEPQVLLNLVALQCQAGAVPDSTLRGAEISLRTAVREPGAMLVAWFDGIVPLVRRGACAGIDRSHIEAILDAAMTNPRSSTLPGRRQDVLHMRGMLALAWNEPYAAADDFDKALMEDPNPQVALEQAAALGRAGFADLGLRHLAFWHHLPPPPARSWRDGMPWLHDLVLRHQGYWDHEFTHLEASLRTDAAHPK